MQTRSEMTQTVDILGFPIANLDMQEAVAEAAALLARNRPSRIVTANAEILYHAYRDTTLGALLQDADCIVPDGIGVVKAAAKLGTPIKTRVAGIDLMTALAAWAAAHGRSIYLLGAERASVEGTVSALLGRYPALKIVGWHDGYFDETEKAGILQEIGTTKPDFLFVGMGFPASDLFFVQHVDQLPVGLMMGVGGSFDVLSGRVSRAPAWIQRMHLEWAFRFAQNPKRLKRIGALPGFLLEVGRYKKQR